MSTNNNIVQPDAFAANFWDSLERSIAAHEGLELKPYHCPSGALSIGYGHNLDAKGVSKATAKFLLDVDCGDSVNMLMVFDWFNKLSNVRRIVLIEMCFNMGLAGLMEFEHMMAAIKTQDWTTAAAEMLASKWATQVGRRARTLAAMMASGQIPIGHLAAMEQVEW